MGIFLLPLWMMWFVGVILSLRIGYVFYFKDAFNTDVIVWFFLGNILAYLYAEYLLSPFKKVKTLWAFKITFAVTTKALSLISFTVAALVYFISNDLIELMAVKTGIFLVTYVVSVGTVIGMKKESGFIAKHNIKITY